MATAHLTTRRFSAMRLQYNYGYGPVGRRTIDEPDADAVGGGSSGAAQSGHRPAPKPSTADARPATPADSSATLRLRPPPSRPPSPHLRPPVDEVDATPAARPGPILEKPGRLAPA